MSPRPRVLLPEWVWPLLLIAVALLAGYLFGVALDELTDFLAASLHGANDGFAAHG
jgi:hypothetical protein